MGSVSRNRSFQKMKVDILRPAFQVDVTTIRDRVMVDYVIIGSNVRIHVEPVHSSLVDDRQIGSISVDRMVGFFDSKTNVLPNDILRENANIYNGNATRHWKVSGKLDFSAYGFPITVDLELMNSQRT